MAICTSSLSSLASALLQAPRVPLRHGASPSPAAVSLVAHGRSAAPVASQLASIEKEFAEIPVLSRRGVALSLGLLAAGLSRAPAAGAASECGEFTVAPSGLAFCDTALGEGVQASKGMLIKAHYRGRLENGKEFDSSYKRGKPLTFRVGVGEVIKGWDQGLAGADGVPAMFAGGKRTLRIPSSLGYGERGAGCRGGSCIIPPNATLIFDVEFVGKV